MSHSRNRGVHESPDARCFPLITRSLSVYVGNNESCARAVSRVENKLMLWRYADIMQTFWNTLPGDPHAGRIMDYELASMLCNLFDNCTSRNSVENNDRTYWLHCWLDTSETNKAFAMHSDCAKYISSSSKRCTMNRECITCASLFWQHAHACHLRQQKRASCEALGYSTFSGPTRWSLQCPIRMCQQCQTRYFQSDGFTTDNSCAYKCACKRSTEWSIRNYNAWNWESRLRARLCWLSLDENIDRET